MIGVNLNEGDKRVSECRINYYNFDRNVIIQIVYNDGSGENHIIKRYAGGIKYTPQYFIGRTRKEVLELTREMSVGM